MIFFSPPVFTFDKLYTFGNGSVLNTIMCIVYVKTVCFVLFYLKLIAICYLSTLRFIYFVVEDELNANITTTSWTASNKLLRITPSPLPQCAPVCFKPAYCTRPCLGPAYIVPFINKTTLFCFHVNICAVTL